MNIKELWKSWNMFQKVALFLILVVNVYILGEVDLFSKLIYLFTYICVNYIIYILLLKPKNHYK